MPFRSGGHFCGGDDGEFSVFVAECAGGETRFADHCYFPSPAGSADILKHQDACAETGATLWYPQVAAA